MLAILGLLALTASPDLRASGDPGEAVARIILADTHSATECFWLDHQRWTGHLSADALFPVDGAKALQSLVPHSGTDWTTTLQFSAGLAGISLGGGFLLRCGRRPSRRTGASSF